MTACTNSESQSQLSSTYFDNLLNCSSKKSYDMLCILLLENYLRRCTAGKACKFTDAGCSSRVARADEDRRTDFHWMTILRSLRSLVGHGKRGKGVAFFGVLLGIRVLLNWIAVGCTRHAFPRVSCWTWGLVQFYQLLCCCVKLQNNDMQNLKMNNQLCLHMKEAGVSNGKWLF